MHYAPVVPPFYAGLLPDTEANFCYATLAVEDASYRSYFARRKNVVMDNPIYERGPWVDPHTLANLVQEIKPRFTIIPDVIDDSLGTLREAARYCARIGDASLTGVPQGHSMEELMDCAKGFYRGLGIRKFGLSIIPTRALGLKRSEWTQRILEEVGSDCLFHWLGGDYPYDDEVAQGRLMPQVLSMDTAEAFNAAFRGCKFGGREPVITNRPNSFLELTEKIDSGLLIDNILTLDAWISEGPNMRTTI